MSSVADWKVWTEASTPLSAKIPSSSATHMGRMSSVASVPMTTGSPEAALLLSALPPQPANVHASATAETVAVAAATSFLILIICISFWDSKGEERCLLDVRTGPYQRCRKSYPACPVGGIACKGRSSTDKLVFVSLSYESPPTGINRQSP